MNAAALSSQVASELMRQHLSGERFTSLVETFHASEKVNAYDVQDQYVKQLIAYRNTEIYGYKVALTTPAMRCMVGYDDSIAGCVLADQLYRSGCMVQQADYGRLLVEFEIAFRMVKDVPASLTPWTRESIFEYVECAYPAIEIADDRFADYASLSQSILTLAADNAWNQGLVLGAPIHDASIDELGSIEGVASLAGIEVGRGTGKEVLGHPLNALAWLANHLSGRGSTLKRGQVVTTGSLVKSQFPSKGTEVSFDLGRLGNVTLHVH
ncbi:MULTISPECIES: fumarylacetoacetate hydrolase family protein [unclassified Variovorax]|uniref:2-keto-4-pentenoate hydratase n=1 Tax=unclassified Variovorax TaxID=663243 RepID=UPI000838F23C|nr:MULTISPECIES: fumarylacetoacetate hydrolase family protein [unclassified Variovorax]PNG51779.1 2-keto-4-pentenoate hydratase [Variovorax sp. B2]PNG54126.1 2-keto-4-pentenoate hydratase [Variovorax sp. B4]VTV11602.1 2-keto-4-pentenoate hydratase [Variovorax sp. WDL1]